MANSSINLTSLDFDTLKSQLKTYMKSQTRFADFDFDGSNINVLLDLLSYNSFTNAFYLNMIGNEMFLDTAQLKDSIVSHAKDLNYTPRSYRSAYANVNIMIAPSNACTSITIPKGTSFNSRIGSNNYTFTTDQNIALLSSNNYFKAENVTLYEGAYISDQYLINYANTVQKFVISNENVDINSIIATVIEDSGATILPYTKADSLFDLNSTSQKFFIQSTQSNKYEVVFGDGVSGRKPKDNSTVLLEYRVSSGELPNGANTFTPDGAIGGHANVIISTNVKASGGAVAETIESIRFNAPRRFTTQERAVTEEDYETLLLSNFPEINTVSAYGGDKADPPQYGKVFVAVDLVNADGLPESKRIIYRDFIKKRSPVSIDPVFISPEYMYIKLTSTVNYNINITKLTPSDIQSRVISAITNFNSTYLDDFKTTLRYSNLTTAIDSAQSSIVSNETDVLAMIKIVPKLNVSQSIDVKFNLPLYDNYSPFEGIHPAKDDHTISSTAFTYQNQTCYLEDNGQGNLILVTSSGIDHSILKIIGTVDYSTGLLQIKNFLITEFVGPSIKIFAKPATRDIFSSLNTILSISTEDLQIFVNGIPG